MYDKMMNEARIFRYGCSFIDMFLFKVSRFIYFDCCRQFGLSSGSLYSLCLNFHGNACAQSPPTLLYLAFALPPISTDTPLEDLLSSKIAALAAEAMALNF